MLVVEKEFIRNSAWQVNITLGQRENAYFILTEREYTWSIRN